LSRVVKSLEEVKEIIPLSREEERAFREVVKVYPFSSTEYYLRLAGKSPAVRRMLLPSLEEVDPALQSLGSPDPLCEERDKVLPHLTHRYPDRALFVVTNVCPVLCRYCMRKRNWKLPPFVVSLEEVGQVVDYLRERPQVRDLLISGGDPLSLPVEFLKELLLALSSVDTLEVVRLGTKVPVVDPERVLDRKLLAVLEKSGKVWVNTHFNHPDEVTPLSAEAVRALLKCAVPVNNQSVLLKGVNDSADVLERLFRELQKIKVRPYYLFHCDPVEGVMHFSTPISEGLKLIRELFKRLSPLAIPYYAVDGPGGYGKVPLLPLRHRRLGKRFLFESFDGRSFEMEDR